MARTTTIVTAFLASPGDLDREREIVSNAIAQWNQVRGKDRSVSFEIIRWETSVAAGFGDYGQDVVNNQIGDDYDIFIALFWTRLGTPTKNEKSGTVEEYKKALSRRKKGDDIELALYFKDGQVSLSEIDLDQAQALKLFRSEAQSDGAFTKDFKSDEALRFEIDLLLDRFARQLSRNTEEKGAAIEANKPEEGRQPSDLGLFDVTEELLAHSTASSKFVEGVSSRLEDITQETDRVTKIFADIGKYRTVEPSDVKEPIARLASKMDVMSHYLEQELPVYSEQSVLMAQNIRDLIDISYDFSSEPDQVEEFYGTLKLMMETLDGSIQSQEDMRESLLGLQRTTTAFNRARRRLAQNYENLINEMKSTRSIMAQALSELEDFREFLKTKSSTH